jgi:hypothetical protein
MEEKRKEERKGEKGRDRQRNREIPTIQSEHVPGSL